MPTSPSPKVATKEKSSLRTKIILLALAVCFGMPAVFIALIFGNQKVIDPWMHGGSGKEPKISADSPLPPGAKTVELPFDMEKLREDTQRQREERKRIDEAIGDPEKRKRLLASLRMKEGDPEIPDLVEDIFNKLPRFDHRNFISSFMNNKEGFDWSNTYPKLEWLRTNIKEDATVETLRHWLGARIGDEATVKEILMDDKWYNSKD
jgi:hypothetical protein